MNLTFDRERLGALCRRWNIAELALFGSVLRADFSPDRSDIDLLIDFLPGARIGFLALAALQEELTELLGRQVDLVPKKGLKPVIRNEVIAGAQVVYAAA